jgi:CheY-like chemotaxis protein
MRLEYGYTVLVVDNNEWTRTGLVNALRHQGMRVLAVELTPEALALLQGIDADAVVVRGAGELSGIARLRRRTVLVRVASEASVEEAARAVNRALGSMDAVAAN